MAGPNSIKVKVGEKYNRWTVISRIKHPTKTAAFWMCRCDCGTERGIESYRLTSGVTKACGCVRKEMKTKHGLRESPEYHAWQHMKRRCLNSAFKQYADYGGRGIKVCDRWMGDGGFLAFYADMGVRPSAVHSLDRVDVNGNYEPSNCRWATKTQQQNNRRDSHYIEWNGVRKTASDWARDIGTCSKTIKHRIKAGWPLGVALTKPPYHKGKT